MRELVKPQCVPTRDSEFGLGLHARVNIGGLKCTGLGAVESYINLYHRSLSINFTRE